MEKKWNKIRKKGTDAKKKKRPQKVDKEVKKYKREKEFWIDCEILTAYQPV